MSSNRGLGPQNLNEADSDLTFLTTVGGAPSSAVDIQNIPLSLIDESDRFRLRQPPYPDIEDLAEQIRSRGQTTPVFVRPAVDGRFDLISGYRRRSALELIGAASALARVYKGLDDAAAYDLAISENADRDDLTDWERAMACLRLKEAGRGAAEIAQQFGWKDRRQAENHIRLAQTATAPVREALQARALHFTHALVLTQAFADVDRFPPAEQARIVEWVATSEPTIRAVQTALRRTPSSGGSDEASDRRSIYRERKSGRIEFSGTIDPSKPEELDHIADELRTVLRKISKLKRRAATTPPSGDAQV